MTLAGGLTDDVGAAIPGLSITIEYQVSPKTGVRTVLFGLFQYEYGVTSRIYQLELCPIDHATHNSSENGMQYGPHEHVGVEVTMRPELGGCSFAQSLTYFCEKINLKLQGEISDPEGFELK